MRILVDSDDELEQKIIEISEKQKIRKIENFSFNNFPFVPHPRTICTPLQSTCQVNHYVEIWGLTTEHVQVNPL